MTTDTYITRIGTEFVFGFEDRNGQFVIHILEQPGYGGREEDVHSTHRNPSADGHTICWTGAMPDLNEAKRIAGLWADYTERYILTGELFPENGL